MPRKRKDVSQALSYEDRQRVEQKVEKMISMPPSHTDPNGSYTGKPVDRFEVPVQDADDL